MPFLPAVRRSQLGPDLHRVQLLGRVIGIRLDGDQVVAMELACRHQQADLSQGTRDGSLVTCPRHGWVYDLATGDCLTEPWARLRRFPVRLDDDVVLVDPTPIRETESR